jgi:hypothetical protein
MQEMTILLLYFSGELSYTQRALVELTGYLLRSIKCISDATIVVQVKNGIFHFQFNFLFIHITGIFVETCFTKL